MQRVSCEKKKNGRAGGRMEGKRRDGERRRRRRKHILWCVTVTLWIFWQECCTGIFRVHKAMSTEAFSPTRTKGRWFLLCQHHFPIHGMQSFIICSGSRLSACSSQPQACLRHCQAKERFCMEWLNWEHLPGMWPHRVVFLKNYTVEWDMRSWSWRENIRCGVWGTSWSCHQFSVSVLQHGACATS